MAPSCDAERFPPGKTCAEGKELEVRTRCRRRISFVGEMRRMLGGCLLGGGIDGGGEGRWGGTWRLVEGRRRLSWVRSSRTYTAFLELEGPFWGDVLDRGAVDRGGVGEMC